MQVGGRRALGETMVAGVLAGGLALGAGTASAETCVAANGDTYSGLSSLITSNVCDQDLIDQGRLSRVPPQEAPATEAPEDTTEDEPPPAETTTPPISLPNVPVPLPGNPPPGTGAPVKPDPDPSTAQPSALPPIPLGNNAPLLAAGAGPGALAATALGAQPAGILPTDLTGTPFEPTLMAAAGIYDPALLLGPGAPGASLMTVGGNPASAVTSASQIQAMALNNSSLGIGATAGVVILAGLGGLVLRQRLMRRVKKAATSS